MKRLILAMLWPVGRIFRRRPIELVIYLLLISAPGLTLKWRMTLATIIVSELIKSRFRAPVPTVGAAGSPPERTAGTAGSRSGAAIP